MEAHIVGLGKQGGHVYVLNVVEGFGLGLPSAAVVENAHVEAAGALGHFQADAAHSDDADGGLVDFRAQPKEGVKAIFQLPFRTQRSASVRRRAAASRRAKAWSAVAFETTPGV